MSVSPDPFDNRHRCRITTTNTGFDDPGVSSVAISVARSHFVKELLPQRDPVRTQLPASGSRSPLFPNVIILSARGLMLLAFISVVSMRLCSTRLVTWLRSSARWPLVLPSFLSLILLTYLIHQIWQESPNSPAFPISARDFLPKLRTFIMSSSVLRMSSSTVLMPARLRQL